jgi:large subunit ribosomal protein L1
MSKKTDLLEKAKNLGLEVTEKNTIAEIELAILEGIKESGKEVVQKEAEEIIESETEKTEVAKSGKRSAKAIAEKEEKIAKEVRKSSEEDVPAKPKQTAKPSRSRLERRGKNYKKAAKQIDSKKLYSLKEAIDLALKTNPAKFDASVEVHARLGVDPRQADQNLRDTVKLPAGTGKTVRVAVFADIDDVAKAKAAGADIAGSEEFLQQLDKGVFDFDILISTPMMMAKLGKYAKALGPKGLMPNPKSGTVTPDVAKAVEEAKAGRVEYRVDSTGIVHVGVGKVSFGSEKIHENISAVFASLKAAKPSSLKGNYVKSIYITTSMGPSVAVENSELN